MFENFVKLLLLLNNFKQQHLIGINRLSSVSSQDSGFTSQEQFFLKSPHLFDESIDYKIACGGTMKATTKSAGFNIQNHHLHSNGFVENPQINSSNQINSNNNSNQDCLLRHTVAGLPLLISNDNNHKTRPALSIHTFDPPPQPPPHSIDQQQNISPAIYAPIIMKDCKLVFYFLLKSLFIFIY